MSLNKKAIINLSPLYMPLISFLAGIVSIRIEYGPLDFENIEWIIMLGSLGMLVGVIVGFIMIIIIKILPKATDYCFYFCISFTMILAIYNLVIIHGAYII